jgi:hypothetical protein
VSVGNTSRPAPIPHSSSRCSHTPLTVGDGGTACHSCRTGIWPMIANVAERSNSWVSGPVKVAPAIAYSRLKWPLRSS